MPPEPAANNIDLGLSDRLRDHLQHIARERDPYLATAGHFYVQTYIRECLQQWGSVESHPLAFYGRTHQNLILKLPASLSEPQQGVVIVGAHYDAVPGSPGADDNGSGVAVLLELARLCAARPLTRPLWFVAFDLEEAGLLGSTAYVEMLWKEKQPIHLMLSLEMLGYYSDHPYSQSYPSPLQYFYPNAGNFLALIGNLPTLLDLWRFRRLFRRQGISCEYLPAGWKGQLVPDTRRSDHAPFWDKGYRAIMVTDTAFLRNPHYHQASDRIETLDIHRMANVCLGLAKLLQNP
jgi:Zn-dependent M28 family amino/carboxypeptidase